jgi:uncharacterized protein YceH (UPF0502 family)
MPNPLPEIERRVVGVLLEKLLSTPAYYPLTINSLTTGCNQKNNRDPEMTLSEEAVRRALAALQPAGLVVSVIAEGARAEKWKTSAHNVYGLANEKQMAVFAELLLRPAHTKSELKTRASRMRHEISAEEVDQILSDFQGRPEPLVVNLGRAPGGRAERFAHTLYSEEEMAKLKAGSVPASAVSPDGHGHAEAALARAPGAAEKLDEALREIAALKERVDRLEASLGKLAGSA